MGEYFESVQASTNKRFVISNNAADAGTFGKLEEILRRARIPCLIGMRESLVALSRWCNYPQTLAACYAPLDDASAASTVAVLANTSADDPALFAAIDAAGVPMVRTLACNSADEAARIADELGYPVALKGTATGVTHKAQRGLVRLNLSDAAAVRAVAHELLERVADIAGERSFGLLVQKMLPPRSFEIFVGARRDPLGTLIVVGAGGVNVEIYRDVAVRIGPVSPAVAAEMLAETKIGRVLADKLDRAGLDELVEIIARFSELACRAADDVAAFEINPMIVGGAGGAIGVDVVRQLRAAT
jgi:acyl-CoA synthetase (NDP forming)